MRIGLHALGFGAGARPEIIRAVATAAEAAGFATLWMGEHVVLVDHSASRYQYSADGRIAVPADADVGWSAEELAALGVPFPRRAERTAEYVAAMRALWANDVASFAGEFTPPRPGRGRRHPTRPGREPAPGPGRRRRLRPFALTPFNCAVFTIPDGPEWCAR